MSLDNQTGNFEVGKDFDALRVNVSIPDGPIDLVQPEGPKVGSRALSESIGWHKQAHLHINQIKQKKKILITLISDSVGKVLEYG